MTRTIQVEVTQDDIAQGRQDSSVTCPVARAITRSLSRRMFEVEVRVVPTGAAGPCYLYIKGRRYEMPDAVRVWPWEFDHYGRDGVSPVSFELEIVED